MAVVLPGLLAAGLAAYGLSDRSLWLDEGATVAIASQHGSALWHAIAHDGGNMLLYYLLMHAVIGVFGAGELALRMPSVIGDVATAVLTALVALRLFGRPRAALAAGMLVAVSLPLVFWAQDARGYSLMVALATASFLSFLVVLDAPTPSAVAGYVLATVFALYFGFDAALVVAAELVVLMLHRLRARVVLGSLVAAAAACVPLAVLALQRGPDQLFWVPGIGASVLGQAGATLASAGMPPNFHVSGTTFAVVALTAVLGASALWRLRADPRAWPAFAWLLVPVAIGLILAAAGQPIELSRAWILAIPAVALLLAAGFSASTGWVALGALVALRLAVLVPTYGVSPENWQAAAAHVLSTARAGDCIAFYPQDGRMPFDYYVRAAALTAPTPVLPDTPWPVVRPYVERYAAPSSGAVGRLARQCPRLWLVASHQGQRHATAASLRNLLRYRSLQADLRSRYTHVRDSRFGYAAVVRVSLYSR